MPTNPRTEYVTREAILKLLSDEEIARVSTAEEAPELVDGDEYVDLDHPERGVLQAHEGTRARAGHVLPRSAVRDETWSKIIGRVAH